MKTVNIWGIKFSLLTKNEIVKTIIDRVRSGERGLHITGVNPEQVAKAQDDKLLKEAINTSDIVNVDGFLVYLSLKFYGYPVFERVASPDVFLELLNQAQDHGLTVYFLGAEPSVIENMHRKVILDFPQLKIVGLHHGFYDSEVEVLIVEEIANLSPDFLFIALPTPLKEKFILKYKKRINVGCFYGVGGAFDVLGGKVKRAPIYFRAYGLEGFIRIIQNPSNYGLRVYRYYTKFIKLVFAEFRNNKIK
ncbi:MAG: WecB/TagA/CpsF family glycosyltransferase [Tannerellaceae bacterium]